ncbi:uncharacterized protein LOC114519142 [Dendronephthya gigantea]|uniref:uncharacterized protein LOC114519142 n=1 Tax=Dendronephthya gigantea TaxID=151771 RepID=UPI00106B9D68|nr:uncharacterized protein LOC114519142 [Dendronephthya gigantea]
MNLLVPLPGEVAGLFVDAFLQYPISCSLVFSSLLYIIYPVFFPNTDATKGYRWIYSCIAIFLLTSTISIFLIPVLALAPDRIIFRPTPSCSIFDRPTRYICLTFNDRHENVFYSTTWKECNERDVNMKNATKHYIISSWIPSFDHFVTLTSVLFQPDDSHGEKKKAYPLPAGYCIRAAGPIEGDRQKVAFYSINGTSYHLLDSGYINSSSLTKFYSGWYLASSCRNELSRWWYNCTLGYVSSHYVRLPQYTRSLLLEGRNDTAK